MRTALLRTFRTLYRAPAFAVVAVVTLALAIAAIGTTFSVVSAVLLKPLPYPGAERIIRVVRSQGSCADCPIARPALFDWQLGSADVFESVGAFHGDNATLTGEGEAEKIEAYRVTPEFWPVMAVQPMLGRAFDAKDDAARAPVVVISHGLWQRRFGGDVGVVGRALVINGEAHDVIGVMPAHFTYPATDVWLPARLAASTRGRDSNYLSVVARLREDRTLAQAEAVMQSVTARQASEFAEEHAGLTAKLFPLKERVTSAVRPALTVLFAASALVVLIAIANLANLVLARTQARRRELATRAALGADRGRLVRHLALEAAVLAFAGTVAGVALTFGAIATLPSLAPDLLPAYNPLVVDAPVLAFVAVVAVVALLGFGLAPAWWHAKADPAGALQDQGRGGSTGRAGTRARAALVVGEVALSLMLLAGAALLVESMRRLSAVDPGVDVDRVVAATVALPATPNLPGEESEAWVARHTAATTPRIDALLERLAALPEVERVALTDAVPLSGRSNTNSTINVIGREYPGGEDAMPLTEWRFVSEGYFEVMGLPVLRGRAFGAQDSHGPGVSTEVLVNDAFVRLFLEGVDPVGQQVDAYFGGPKTIVGVVGSARQWGLARDASPEVYFPVHDSFVTDLDVVARTRLAPELAVEPLRRALRAAAPDVPVTAARTMREIVAGGDTMRRFFAILMTAFSAVALVLATVGLYGVIAYSVAQRRVEIGVRMSLGADRASVLSMVMGQGVRLVAIGLAIGVAGALALSDVLGSLLFGVAPRDPLVLGAVALALLATGALACAIPALRASRIAPMEALRHV